MNTDLEDGLTELQDQIRDLEDTLPAPKQLMPGENGWIVPGTFFTITDPEVLETSVVQISITEGTTICGTTQVTDGSFSMSCTEPVDTTANLNYIIFS